MVASLHDTRGRDVANLSKRFKEQPVYLGKTALSGKTDLEPDSSGASHIILRLSTCLPPPARSYLRSRLSPPRYRVMQSVALPTQCPKLASMCVAAVTQPRRGVQSADQD